MAKPMLSDALRAIDHIAVELPLLGVDTQQEIDGSIELTFRCISRRRDYERILAALEALPERQPLDPTALNRHDILLIAGQAQVDPRVVVSFLRGDRPRARRSAARDRIRRVLERAGYEPPGDSHGASAEPLTP